MQIIRILCKTLNTALSSVRSVGMFTQALLLCKSIAINLIIISYKISINYCSIKMQIVIILSKTLNTALSSVRSVGMLTEALLLCQSIAINLIIISYKI